MNRKQLVTLLLVGVVVGGLGYYYYGQQKDSYRTSDTTSGQKLLPNFPLNDVAHVRIQQAGGELNLQKKDDVWKVKERYDYPANFSEVGDFLRKIWELKTVQNIEVGPSQFGRLELNPPGPGTNTATLVEFKDKGDAALKSLQLGKKYMKESSGPGPMGMGGGDFPVGRYVMVPGNPPKVYLINDALSNVETKPDAWLSKDFFKVEKIKSVSVTHTNAAASWALSRETETGEFKLADPKPGEQLDAGKASGTGHALSSPSFNDILSPQAKPEETGLANPILAKIETFEGFAYTVKLGKGATEDNYNLTVAVEGSFPKERAPGKDEKPEDKDKLNKEFAEKTKKLEEKLKQEKAYEKWTYQVSKWTVEPLLKERKDFMAEKKEEPKKDGDAKGDAFVPPNPLNFAPTPPAPPVPPTQVPPAKAPGAEIKTPALEVKLPSVEVKTPVGDIKTPTLEVKPPSVELKTPPAGPATPKIEIKPPSIEVKAPEAKAPAVEVKAPEVKAPAVEVKAPKVEVKAPAVEVKTPTVDVTAPKVEVKAPAVEVKTTAPAK